MNKHWDLKNNCSCAVEFAAYWTCAVDFNEKVDHPFLLFHSGFDPSILRHSGILGAADEAVIVL
jgi:hypothetical protein